MKNIMLVNSNSATINFFSGYFLQEVTIDGFIFSSSEEINVSNYDHLIVVYQNDEEGIIDDTPLMKKVTRRLDFLGVEDGLCLFVDPSSGFGSMAAVMAVIEYCKRRGGIPLRIGIKEEKNTYYFYQF